MTESMSGRRWFMSAESRTARQKTETWVDATPAKSLFLITHFSSSHSCGILSRCVRIRYRKYRGGR